MAVEEVRNGNFVYRDTLFVDLGEGKRHPRAAASELKDLLLPKKGNAPTKDQVAHWYEAQLLHYGLPRSKDKNTAKVRLTAALSSGNLTVPSSILNMESDLKKEYAVAARKAKAAAKSSQARSDVHAVPKSKDKKTVSNNTATVSVKIGDMEINVGRGFGAGSGNPAKKKVGTTGPVKATATPKSKKPADATTTTRPPARPQTTSSSSRTKQTARRERPFNDSSQPLRRAIRSSPDRSHYIEPAHYENEVDMDDAPPPYEELDYYDHDRTQNNNVVQISGSYGIHASDYKGSTETFIRLDNDYGQLWGHFTVGSKTCIILVEDIDGVARGQTRDFMWRSEDTETGRCDFRRDQGGHIAFSGNGHVSGCFYALMFGQDVEFEGNLEVADGPDVQHFRSEWDAIPRRAYGRG